MGGKLAKPLLIIGGILLVLVLQFNFIFLLLALLPAVVAYYIDHEPGKPTFRVVFACNFSATLPFLMPMIGSGLMFKNNNIGDIISTPYVWLVVYTGAAVGWCLVYVCYALARFMIVLLYDYKISVLERFQKKLIDEWGAQITSHSS